MENKITNIYEMKYKKMLNVNLNNDIIYINKNKRDIRKEIIKGYMQLLTNKINYKGV